MAALINRNGTDDNDILTYDQGGSSVVYHAGLGNDNISITGGSGISVILDGGNNTINITGGSLHTIKVAETETEANKINGTDNLTVDGADMIDASLGSGKDSFTFSNSNGRKASGALSQVRGGNWGDTFNINAGTQKYQMYGELGDDTFNINAGNNINFWGGSGRDIFNINGGICNKHYGGDSEDTFNIRADNQTVVLGYGGSISQQLYDTVNAYSGDGQTIYCNLGINQINLYAGKNHIIIADIDKALSKNNGYTDAQINAGIGLGYGVDNVCIDGASNVTANTGDGKDVVIVKGGTGHNISTDGWGDTIKISGAVSNSVFAGGAADDSYEITWAGLGNGNIIDQTTALAIDNDSLTITDAISNSFEFSLEGDTFTLTETATGKALTINGWGNGLNGISFADKTISGDEFFAVQKALVINDGQAHGTVKLGQKADAANQLEGYSVNLIKGTVNDVYAVYSDTTTTITAIKNTLTIYNNGKTVADNSSGFTGDAVAAYVKTGQANENTVTVNGGTVAGVVMAAKVKTGVANNNDTVINGGLVNSVYGASVQTGVSSNNSVTMEKGTVNGNIYGSNITGNGNATNNIVMVKGGTVAGSVYGGCSSQGQVKDNSVVLSGNSVILNDVYTNAGAATQGNGAVTVGGSARVEGTIYGGSGVDTITISGGTVDTIDGKGGADNIIINSGTVDKISDTLGNNRIEVNGGAVNKIVTGTGNDNIVVAGGNVCQIEAGAGNDSITISWSAFANTLKLVQGSAATTDADELKLTGISYEALTFKLEQTTLTIKDAANKSLAITDWGKGFNEINIAGTVYGEAQMLGLGNGNDEVDITGDNGRFYTNEGDDTITVSGKNNYIEAGDGMNNITLNENANGNTLVVGSGDNVITVNGSNNTVNIGSGDNTIILGYTEDDDNSTLSPSNNSFTFGDGDNSMDLYAGYSNSITTGEGYDSISVYGGSGHTIATGENNDEIVVYDGNNLTLRGGTGDDLYDFEALKRGGTYTVDQSDAAVDDYDIITLLNYTSGNFTITEATNTLTIKCNPLSSTITVKGWDNCVISEIQFGDTTLYYGEGSAEACAAETASYDLLLNDKTIICGNK